DERFKQLLSGLISVVNGVSSIRNELGDAHGKEPTKKYRIDKRHAILMVKSAEALAEYLYLTHLKGKQNS
ncbi:MAG: abortive infection family protein, partial [Bacteroidota bacterium]